MRLRKPITKEQIQAIQNNGGNVEMIDIRSAAEYEKLHVPGAINIPVEQLAESFPMFSKKDAIVCICNHGKERSQNAAEIFFNAGFENAFYLEGGTSGWHT